MAGNEAFSAPRPLQVNEADDLVLLTVPVAGDATTDASLDVVALLDDVYIKEAFTGVSAKVYVTGETAFNRDLFAVVSNSFG